MAAMFSENAQTVLRFLQANVKGQYTADDIAEATGLPSKSINGIATGLQKKGLTERVEVEGIEKKVIRLTDAGKQVDPSAEKPVAE
jgi:DNA-binding MarR family transcriptional regulator